MKDEVTFFDENPVVDDEPKPRAGSLIIGSLPTDICSGDPVFVSAEMKIARSKSSGQFELRPLTRGERFARWLDKRPRLKAVLEGMASAAVVLLPRRR